MVVPRGCSQENPSKCRWIDLDHQGYGVTSSNAARMSERRFAKLIQNIHDTVTVVDALGEPVWSSSLDRGDLGYEQDFWRSADLFSLVHDDDRAQIDAHLAELLAVPSSSVSGEVRLVSPDGRFHHVGYIARNLLSDPDIEGIVITSRNVDAEVQIRSDRETRQRELEDALADRSRFITRLSHEMRSPLHAIQGLAEVVLGSPTVTSMDRHHVESIDREAQVLRRMIDDLLDLSKIGAGHMELEVASFMPAEVVDSIGLTNRAQAELKGLALHVEISPDVPRVVLGDEYRLRQVLVNLVSNAIKYTDNGSILLNLKRGSGDMLSFVVADTGRGIPEDKAEVLFEPYRQMQAADSSVGTGIGLTITKMLVELMGGTISFESSPAGTTFTCEIPLKEGRRATDRSVADQQRRDDVAPSIILVVDDSEVNRILASAQIERLGHSAEFAASGTEAIAMIGTTAYDLVLMDWHMPELDGLETTRRIRAMGASIAQPTIVAMTASVMTGDREQCLAAGMNDYLAKPVSVSDLGAMIDSWSESTTEVAAAAEGSTTTLDDHAIERLVEDLGDTSVAHSIVMTFLTELSNWRDQLETGVFTGDLETARRAAHTVKSTAAMLGATALSEACKTFEHDATSPSNAERLLKQVLHNADETERELTKRVGQWDHDMNKEGQP